MIDFGIDIFRIDIYKFCRKVRDQLFKFDFVQHVAIRLLAVGNIFSNHGKRMHSASFDFIKRKFQPDGMSVAVDAGRFNEIGRLFFPNRSDVTLKGVFLDPFNEIGN